MKHQMGQVGCMCLCISNQNFMTLLIEFSHLYCEIVLVSKVTSGRIVMELADRIFVTNSDWDPSYL